MGPSPASRQPRATHAAWAALACAAAGAALFQLLGNAGRGYIDTGSVFWWWIRQWLNPASETQHGWLILAISGWLLWRNLHGREEQGKGGKEQERGGQPTTQNPELKTGHTGEQAKGSTEQEVGAEQPRRDAAAQLQTPNAKLQTARPAPAQLETQSPMLDTWPMIAPLGAMTGALVLHAVGFAAQQTRVSIVALLVFTWGVLRLGGGRRWGAAAVFPLGFLVFAIPVDVLDSVGFWLRMWVIDASASLAHAAGIDVVRNGTQLLGPDGRYNYDVDAACSGVRSLVALTALSLLVGYLNFRTLRRRVLILLLCLPLVYLGNVARISAIVLAAQFGGQAWGDRAHDAMGYGVFAIVLGGVLAGVALLRRFAPEHEGRGKGTGGRRAAEVAAAAPVVSRPGSGTSFPSTANEPPRGKTAAPILVAVIVVGCAVAEMAFLHRLSNRLPRDGAGVVLAPDGRNPVELPTFLGREWIGAPVPVSAVEHSVLPPDTGFSRMEYVAPRDGRRVFLSIVLSGRDRTSIHRPEICLVGQGWTITGRGTHAFAYPGRGDAAFTATVLRVRGRRAAPPGATAMPQLVAYWFVGGDRVVSSHWSRLACDAWNRLARGRADRWAYVLMQADATDGEAAALERMQVVLKATLPVFQKVPTAQIP